MMNRYIIFGVALLLLSCGNRKGADYDETYDGGAGVGVDTATIHIIQCQPEIEKEPVNERTKTVSPSKDRYKSTSHDNMRGFDPASEDDMHDNGMTRYMEVNDEKGWD